MPNNLSKNPFMARHSSLIDIFLISVIWIVSVILVNPIGEFPINDDWSFALTTKKFYESGVFQPLGWAAMPQLTNTIWGALFLLPDGFSFSALRISTLTISLIGVWAIYLILIRIKCNRMTSLAVTATLAFSPIYYPLSLTFMTDVLFVALVAVSCYFFVQNILHFSWPSYLAATIVIVAATLSRQLALALPVGYAGAYLLRYGRHPRSIILATIPFLACISAYLLLRQSLAINGKLPDLFDSSNSNLFLTISQPLVALRRVPNNLYVALIYLGLILSPVMACCIFTERKSKENIKEFVGILFIFLLFGVLRSFFHNMAFLMPVIGNTFNPAGLGPFLMNDFEAKSVSLPALPDGVRVVLTVVALISAVEISIRIFSAAKLSLTRLRTSKLTGYLLSPTESVMIFALITFMAGIIPLLLVGFYDRYLLSVLPILIIILFSADDLSIKCLRTRAVTLSLVALVVVATIAASRDMLNWHRARWEGVNYLKTKLGADDREIDGGFEFNGLCCYSLEYPGVDGKSWWWVADDLYRIGFGVPDGYALLKEFKYERLLPPGHGAILVSKRASND